MTTSRINAAEQFIAWREDGVPEHPMLDYFAEIFGEALSQASEGGHRAALKGDVSDEEKILYWMREAKEAKHALWQAQLAAPASPQPTPSAPVATQEAVTEFNVGRYCLSEDDCIAEGLNFAAYERGIADAAAAFARNTK